MVGGPAQYGTTALTLRCTKGDGKPGVSRCMRGAGLSLWRRGRPRLTGQPSSRTGENPPYGMSGGIEETSASCEARSAPRSYPTSTRQPGIGQSLFILRSMGSDASPSKPQHRPAQSTQTAGEMPSTSRAPPGGENGFGVERRVVRRDILTGGRVEADSG